jgi:uncharacterized protein (TIGR02118 family)
MYKLMILIPPEITGPAFDEAWPEFLHNAERMPGLVREASIRVITQLSGNCPVGLAHELFFESQQDLHAAMSSPEGESAGQILQQITQGKMTLLMAEHREDDIENLRQYRRND